MKINFNVKSVKAWAALGSAIIGAVVLILAALGIVVKPTDNSAAASGQLVLRPNNFINQTKEVN